MNADYCPIGSPNPLSPRLIAAMLLLIGIISLVTAADPPPPSLFADKRALAVGDVVTILLMEYTAAANQAATATGFEHKLEGSSGTTGALEFIPGLGFETGITSDQKSNGNTSRQGSLKGKISARVVEVAPNGLLKLEGQRTIDVNGEQQVMTLKGLVRTKDVLADNTVYSYNISEAVISYRGRGMVDQAAKPGWLTRFFNWLF